MFVPNLETQQVTTSNYASIQRMHKICCEFGTTTASLRLVKPRHQQARLQMGKLLLQDHTQVQGKVLPREQKRIYPPLLVCQEASLNRDPVVWTWLRNFKKMLPNKLGNM